jgi:ATP-dependent DNA ligase
LKSDSSRASPSLDLPRRPSGGEANLFWQGHTGFALAAGRELAERLGKIERDTLPFVSVPRAYQKGARWVDPRLVAEVTFTTWTADNLLRHPRSRVSARTRARGR